jgi:cytochrome c5
MMRQSLGCALLGTLLPVAVVAAPPASTGAQVVEEHCAACHASGREGAPRIGDAKAWGPRAKQGLGSLTASAIEGVRKMPPHGGKLSLTDHEIQLAITEMVNRSGGNWARPIDRSALPQSRRGQAIVEGLCSECHATGKNGAPRIGDEKAWVGRAREGFDGLVRSAIAGHGGMPARGGMADLTDAEIRSAVTWMFQKSVKKE